MGEACLRVEAAALRLEKEGQGRRQSGGGGSFLREGDKVGEVAQRFLSCDLTFRRHSFALLMLWDKRADCWTVGENNHSC